MNKYPSFEVEMQREPEEGEDYSLKGISQDEHDYIFGEGDYFNNPAEYEAHPEVWTYCEFCMGFSDTGRPITLMYAGDKMTIPAEHTSCLHEVMVSSTGEIDLDIADQLAAWQLRIKNLEEQLLETRSMTLRDFFEHYDSEVYESLPGYMYHNKPSNGGIGGFHVLNGRQWLEEVEDFDDLLLEEEADMFNDDGLVLVGGVEMFRRLLPMVDNLPIGTVVFDIRESTKHYVSCVDERGLFAERPGISKRIEKDDFLNWYYRPTEK